MLTRQKSSIINNIDLPPAVPAPIHVHVSESPSSAPAPAQRDDAGQIEFRRQSRDGRGANATDSDDIGSSSSECDITAPEPAAACRNGGGMIDESRDDRYPNRYGVNPFTAVFIRTNLFQYFGGISKFRFDYRSGELCFRKEIQKLITLVIHAGRQSRRRGDRRTWPSPVSPVVAAPQPPT